MRLIVSLALLLPLSTEASTIRRFPETIEADTYSAIFIGEVTGIHLRDYETHLLGKDERILMDGIGNVLISVVVERLLDGKTNQAIEVNVGTKSRVPELKEKGLFLLPKGSKFALVIWSSDTERYDRFMLQASDLKHAANFSSKPTP
jgi:hypothetical protein